MKMQAKQGFWGGLLIGSLPGILLGLLLILIPTALLLKAIFTILGVMIIFSALPTLIMSVSVFRARVDKLSLFSALISVAMGIVLIFWHNNILMIVAGVYLLLLPTLKILLSKERARQFKSSLPSLIIGAVLVVLGPSNALDALLDLVGWAVLAVTAILALIAILSYAKRSRQNSNKTGNRIFVDHNGDGTVDAVFVDTTGDGQPDTERTYRENK